MTAPTVWLGPSNGGQPGQWHSLRNRGHLLRFWPRHFLVPVFRFPANTACSAVSISVVPSVMRGAFCRSYIEQSRYRASRTRRPKPSKSSSHSKCSLLPAASRLTLEILPCVNSIPLSHFGKTRRRLRTFSRAFASPFMTQFDRTLVPYPVDLRGFVCPVLLCQEDNSFLREGRKLANIQFQQLSEN
jgi:hypothetical protein